MADGAGNTIGTVLVYTLVVLIVFAWYHNSKKDNKDQEGEGGNGRNGGERVADMNGHHSILESAISFSKPAAALRTAQQSFGFTGGDSLSGDSQHAWI